jgi:uncharacterized phage infection (PIP) family protein YhgE
MVTGGMRLWGLLAVSIALFGGLGVYRLVTLEQRLDALAKQLGQAATSSGAHATPGFEERLRKLEAEIATLRQTVRELEQVDDQAVATGPNIPDDKILAVVTRAQSRILDRQLQFGRDRWLEWREGALSQFAHDFGLSASQTQQLHQLLTDEIDTMMEIMRRPDALENPEQSATDWQARLDKTDDAVRNLLAPHQNIAWEQARAAERQTLWPWLPKK